MIQSELLAEYRQAGLLRGWLLLSLLPVVFFLLIIVFNGLSNATLIGISCCVVAAILIAVYSIKTHILLYPNKLVKHSLFGSKILKINAKTEFYFHHFQPWRKIPSIHCFFITIKQEQQSVTFYANVKDISSLQALLVELEKTYQQPAIKALIIKGQSIQFGDLKISSTGLTYKKQVLAFHELKNFSLQQGGSFRIQLQGKTSTFLDIPMRKIPNMTTLFTLLDHYLDRKTP